MGFVKGTFVGMIFGAMAGMIIGATNCDYMQDVIRNSRKQMKRFKRKYSM